MTNSIFRIDRATLKIEYFLPTTTLLLLLLLLLLLIILKGSNQDVLVSCRQKERSSGPDAIMCKSRAEHGAHITCSMSCATKVRVVRRDSSAIMFDSV